MQFSSEDTTSPQTTCSGSDTASEVSSGGGAEDINIGDGDPATAALAAAGGLGGHLLASRKAEIKLRVLTLNIWMDLTFPFVGRSDAEGPRGERVEAFARAVKLSGADVSRVARDAVLCMFACLLTLASSHHHMSLSANLATNLYRQPYFLFPRLLLLLLLLCCRSLACRRWT